MDWKTFFANVIGSLAWPILVGVVIYLLRDEMAALLRRMKGAKIAALNLRSTRRWRRHRKVPRSSRANTLRRTSPYTFLMNGN
jgi:membrane protein DedA with SNARE-associated domain